MRKAILDTSFILTCVRQKIDFFEQIELIGMKIMIPEQVLKEIERTIKSNKKLHFRENAILSLKIINKNNFQKIDLKTNYVDKGLKRFADKNPDAVIATLDAELKREINNPKLIIKGRKKLDVVN